MDPNRERILFRSNLMKIFSSTLTFRIGPEPLEGWELFRGLASASLNLTFINSTKAFVMTWDYSNLINETFALINTCLDVSRESANFTNMSMILFNRTCSDSRSSTVTIAVNESLADRWKGIAFINVSSSPPQSWIVKIVNIDLSRNFGTAGMVFAMILLVAVIAVGFKSPIWGVSMGILGFSFLTLTRLLPLNLSLVFSVIIIGFVVIFAIRRE